MAKFCGRCGSRLDEETGLCPRCDAARLASIRAARQQQQVNYAQQSAGDAANNAGGQKPLSKRQARKQAKKQAKEQAKAEKQAAKVAQKAAKKAAKRAKRENRPLWRKILGWILRLVLILALIALLAVGILALLSHFHVINIPALDNAADKIVALLPNSDSEEDAASDFAFLDVGFTDIQISDEETAIQAAQESAAQMGYKNAFNELKPYTSAVVGDKCFYRLQQYYKGIPVYGRYVSVIASDSGESLGIASDCLDIEETLELKPSVTDAQVKAAIEEYAAAVWGVLYDDISIPKLSDDDLVIYNQDGSATLAYLLKIINGDDYTVVVDAKTGKILESTSNTSDVASTGTDVSGSQSFPVDYDKETDTYTICDSNQNIYVYNLNKKNSKKSDWKEKAEAVQSASDNIFGNTDAEKKQSPEIAINLINTVERIADYYSSTFGQGVPFGGLVTCYNDGYYWGKNALGGARDLQDGGEIGFLSVGYALNCTEQDVLAHEYTHVVARQYDASTGDSKSSGAISEGIADTFACFYTNDWDIDLTVVGGSHRDASDPSKYKYPASITDKKNSDEDTSHAYATVVSHAAYLMSESKTFSDDELQKLWYETMICLPHNCSFYDLRFIMEKVSVIEKCSTSQKDAIDKAFDEVGITNSESYNCGNTISINVYDKKGNLYDDYKIEIEGKTSGGLFGIGSEDYSLSVDHKTTDEHKLELEDGEYTISITDNGNDETTDKYKIKVKKSNSVENLYAFDYGADYYASPNADMSVLDKKENIISDYTATAFYGKENYTLQNASINIPEKNYYNVLLSYRADELGVTYYYMFSLRVRSGLDNKLVIKTNFEPSNSIDNEDSNIPADAVPWGGHYYYLYDMDNISSWDDAKKYCEEQGGYLATITSAEEDAFLFNYMRSQNCDSAMFGLYDASQGGDSRDWKWVTGEAFSYRNWEDGEPNNYYGDEYYGGYYWEFSDGKWNDGSYAGDPFLCEWSEGSPAKAEQPTTTTIPTDATEWGGHYYYLYDMNNIDSWSDAKKYCEAQGGYLATVTSEEEDTFLYQYMRSKDCDTALFGLYDANLAVGSRNWKWVTDEALSYQNWADGEPNNYDGDEYYGGYYWKNSDGKWNDLPGDENAFLCEWGEGSATPKPLSQERDVVLVLDCSGSMGGTPIEETKKAATEFLDTILDADANLGIVTYESDATRAAEFSTEKGMLQSTIDEIGAGGGTNFESALRTASEMLAEGQAKKKIIVLMSDGYPESGLMGDDLISYADQIKNNGTLIYTLGFFQSMSASDKVGPQQLMEKLASPGCHYEVENADDLVYFFGDMADQVSGQKYIYISIACPVEVTVTYNGETLSSAEAGQNLRTDFGTLTFAESSDDESDSSSSGTTADGTTENRVKILRLKEGVPYDVQIVGTGRGVMNYTIGFMDDDGEYSDLRTFENVKITKDTVIDTVAEPTEESVLNIDEDGDGKYDRKLRATENGHGEEVKFTVPIYIVLLGSSAVLLLVAILIIIFQKKRNNKKER